jgi:hypothetical protein
MPRLTPEQQLAKAQQDKAKAEAKIRAASAKLRRSDRATDTRRKILAGAVILSAAEKDEKLMRWLMRQVATMPERDRAIFKDWNSGAE